MKQLVNAILIITAATFSACNNTDTQNKNSTTQTDTSGMKQIMATNEMYTCTMHNEVMSDKPGKCPKCDMKLVKQKMTSEQEKMMKEGTYIKSKE